MVVAPSYDDLIPPRSRHTVSVVGSMLVVLGGCGLNGVNDYVSELSAFNFERQSWTQVGAHVVSLSLSLSLSLEDF